jgi:hypothetical protein
MQNSNQFNNIFRQIQNGYIRRSSSEEARGSFFVPDPPPDSSPPEVWEEYVSDLHTLLFLYMLGSVYALSDEEWKFACKARMHDPKDTFAINADYFDDLKTHNCVLVAEGDSVYERLHNTEFGKALTNNIYVAHQYLTRAYEDEAYALEEGGPIE